MIIWLTLICDLNHLFDSISCFELDIHNNYFEVELKLIVKVV